jgi:hypothetical protein
VVSRRGAHHAPAFLLVGHQRELVERPADLVRPHPLKQLGLEPHVEAGAVAELARREQRRPLDVGVNARPGDLEIVERQGEHVRA